MNSAPRHTARQVVGPAGQDLRLLGPALATWVGALAGIGTGVEATLARRGVLAGVVLVTLAVIARSVLVRSPGRRAGAATWAVAAMTASLAGGAAVGSVHRAALGLGPLHELAAERASATVAATVTGDPRRVAPRVDGVHRSAGWLLTPVRATMVEARGRQVRLRAPLLVIAQDRRWSRLLPGQRLRVTGRLGPARSGEAATAVLSVSAPPDLVGRAPAVQRAAGGLRAGLRAATEGLPADQRGLLPGLVVGDTSRMPAGLVEDFRTAGLTHLTAVSGANLAIVTGFVLLVGRRLGVRGRALPLLAGVAMAGFVVLARPQPSVVRAAVMGAVALLALAGGRRHRSLPALAVTVVALLLADPWLARSYGFVLSVLATGALVLLAPRWARAWRDRGLPEVLAQATAVPLAAQLVCAPVVVLLSAQVSLVAVPANVLVAPAIAPATVLGVLATLASAVHPPSAAALAWLAACFVWWVVVVARSAADLPWAAVEWPGTPPGAALLAAGMAVAVLLVGRAARRPRVALGLVVTVLAVAAVPMSRPGWPPPGWVLAVCDVGQGDALVLAAGPGSAVMVDAGPDPRRVDACLRGLQVRRVVLVLLTHLHADHVEGLPGVLRGRPVGEVQVGAWDEPAEQLARVRRWTSGAGVPLTRAAVGDRVRVGRVRWEVIWPRRVIHAGSLPNNASTVLLVDTGGLRLLLTGDIEPEAQRGVLARGIGGRVDVLKVAHHGSAYQDPELLAVARPRVALISAGADNDYGHPAPATVRAVRRSGAVLGRTDRDGTLLVVGSGRRLRLVTAAR